MSRSQVDITAIITPPDFLLYDVLKSLGIPLERKKMSIQQHHIFASSEMDVDLSACMKIFTTY